MCCWMSVILIKSRWKSSKHLAWLCVARSCACLLEKSECAKSAPTSPAKCINDFSLFNELLSFTVHQNLGALLQLRHMKRYSVLAILPLLVHLPSVTHHRRLLRELAQADVASKRSLSRVGAHVVD